MTRSGHLAFMVRIRRHAAEAVWLALVTLALPTADALAQGPPVPVSAGSALPLQESHVRFLDFQDGIGIGTAATGRSVAIVRSQGTPATTWVEARIDPQHAPPSSANPITFAHSSTSTPLGVWVAMRAYDSNFAGGHYVEVWLYQAGSATLLWSQNAGDPSISLTMRPTGDSMLIQALDGGEWLVSDGTPAGTLPFADSLAIDLAGTPLEGYITDPVVLDDEVWFFALSLHGSGVWKGPLSGPVELMTSCTDATGFTRVGTRVVFAADTFAEGLEPWASDGTPAGTQLLADIRPGGNDSLVGSSFFAVGERAYFRARPLTTPSTRLLWTTDGTPAGTLSLGVENPTLGPHSLGDDYAFAASSAGTPSLWRSDGTPGGTFALEPASQVVAAVGGRMLFIGAGVLRASDLSGAASEALAAAPGFRMLAQRDGGDLLYLSTDATTQLWQSDGTAAGTTALAEVGSPPPSSGANIAEGDGMLFWTVPSVPFPPLAGGTSMFRDGGAVELWNTWPAHVPADTGLPSVPCTGRAALASSLACFSTQQVGLGFNRQVWFVDAADASVSTAFPSDPGALSLPLWARGGSTLYFGWGFPVYLYEADGSPGSVVQTSPLLVADPFTAAACVTEGSGSAYWFGGIDGTPGDSGLPVRSDGTTVEHVVGATPISACTELVESDGRLYAFANDGAGIELWSSDFSIAGTGTVVDLAPGPANAPVSELLSLGDGTALFDLDGVLWASAGTPATTAAVVAQDMRAVGSVAGLGLYAYAGQLWRSDGSGTGTQLLGDVDPAAGRSTAVLDGWLYFAGSDGGGNGLFRSDGSSVELVLHLDAIAGAPEVALGRVYFTGCDLAHGCEPWVSDGSTAGTHLRFDLVPGPSGSDPDGYAGVSPNVFTTAVDGEVWLLPEGCGNALLDLGETCDDGNLVDGDGCSSTCRADTSTRLVGSAQGGSVELTIAGKTLTLDTTPDQSAVQIVAALAALIQADPNLQFYYVIAHAIGDRLVVDGDSAIVVIQDAGLEIGGAPIPLLPYSREGDQPSR